MKKLIASAFILTAFLSLLSCGKSGEHHHDQESDTTATDNPNQALYNQVMEIHDEVMPKTGDIYGLKKELQEKLDKTADGKEKEELKQTISLLDSADHAMMDWMHHFNPADTTSQEAAREYLESEMEKIKKVKDLVNESLEKAKAQTGKKN
jgi:hypothetical protein